MKGRNIKGTKDKPRITIFRSNKYLYVQLIDDESGKTIAGMSEKDLKSKSEDVAKELGLEFAKLAKSKKINEVVFDRGKYAYHGRVKKIAEGAREGGLTF